MGALLVFVGGGTGALLRYGAGRLAALAGAAHPLATLAVNVAGCLAMGLLLGWLAQGGEEAADRWRLLLGTGLLGGFTTFSAFSADAVLLWQRGGEAQAIAYVIASVILSLVACAAGLWLVRG